MRSRIAIALVLWSSAAFAQVGPAPGVQLQDEGANQGRVQILNCAGTGVTCSKSGVTGTVTISGGSGYSTIQDETTPLTQRATVNFTGSGVSCVDNSGATRTDCTISGGAGASWTEYEIDFGLVAKFVDVETVTDGAVSGSSKIMVLQSGAAATGRQSDENEMDVIQCNANPGTGQFTLRCHSERTRVHGKFKVLYTVS